MKFEAAILILMAAAVVAVAGGSALEVCGSVPCPDKVQYVCGNNNVTYRNPCALAVDSCRSNGTILAAHSGTCHSTTKMPNVTFTDDFPTDALSAPATTATPTTTLKPSSTASVAASLAATALSAAVYFIPQ